MCGPKIFIGTTLALSLLVSIMSFAALGAMPWTSFDLNINGFHITQSMGLFKIATSVKAGSYKSDDVSNVDDYKDPENGKTFAEQDDDVVNSTPSVWRFGRAVTILGGLTSFAGFIYTCVALGTGRRTACAEKVFGSVFILFGCMMIIGAIVWGSHFQEVYNDVLDLDDKDYTACDGFCAIDATCGVIQLILGSVWLVMSGIFCQDKFQDLDTV